MVSEPANTEATVHFASLLLLFFNSVASTAPRWLSSLLRQSTLPGYYNQHARDDIALKHWNNVSLANYLGIPFIECFNVNEL